VTLPEKEPNRPRCFRPEMANLKQDHRMERVDSVGVGSNGTGPAKVINVRKDKR
jgi:hypothetical protein